MYMMYAWMCGVRMEHAVCTCHRMAPALVRAGHVLMSVLRHQLLCISLSDLYEWYTQRVMLALIDIVPEARIPEVECADHACT